MELHLLEKASRQYITELQHEFDSAHDLAHTIRVVASAKKILQNETAAKPVVIAAAWLHDCVSLPKNHPDRKRSSRLAAKRAVAFLESIDFPRHLLDATAHAIEAHSYSGGVAPETIEAKIVQDADRLDALGAIGIARCLMVGGAMDRKLYHPSDPFAKNRQPDDDAWNIDHFYTKLFRLPETMHTRAAKEEAGKRVQYMKEYLQVLGAETGIAG